MAYQVNRYNGSFLVSVADGTIDQSTDLRFLGKNYAGYGQVQNENFLHLLENFAGAGQPSKPISGQLWFDTTERKIKIFDGIRFRNVGGATPSRSAPTGLSAGEFWFDNVSNQLYCWTGAEYTLIGPENPSNLGETSVTSQVIKGTDGVNRSIAKLKAGGITVAVLSKDTFTIDTNLLIGNTSDLAGFERIKKGITLVDTNNNTGVTSLSSGTLFWGTASASKGLIDTAGILYDIDTLVKKNQPIFDSTVSLVDGFNIGPAGGALFTAQSTSDQTFFTNQSGTSTLFRFRTGPSTTSTTLNITSTALLPGNTNLYSIGTSSSKWKEIYSTDFIGNFTGDLAGTTVGTHRGNVRAEDNSLMINSITKQIVATRFDGDFFGQLTGNATTATNALRLNDLLPSISSAANSVVVRGTDASIIASRFIGITNFADRIKIDNSADDSGNPDYKSAKTTKTANTIAARDAVGNLSANVFNGTATAVQGADLAEKYLADQEYPIGTVVTVGGSAEIKSVDFSDRAIGVVSANPGLIMNEELVGGTLVALKGRVPVRVVGSIRKGDRLVSSSNGCAIHASFHQHSDVFAVALETNLNTEEKLVEAVVL